MNLFAFSFLVSFCWFLFEFYTLSSSLKFGILKNMHKRQTPQFQNFVIVLLLVVGVVVDAFAAVVGFVVVDVLGEFLVVVVVVDVVVALAVCIELNLT